MRYFKKKKATTFHCRRSFVAAFLVVTTVVATGFLSSTPALSASPVEAMVSNFGNQVLSILANGQSVDQQKTLFRKAFLHNANIEAIANFTLGKYRRRLKPTDRDLFHVLLSDYIVQLFVVKLRGTQSEGLEILKTTELKKDRDYLVKSVIKLRKIPGQTDTPIPVKWRIKKDENEDLKLYDISIGGFCLAQEQRSTFVDLISRNNGRISALLNYLKMETGG